MTLKNISSSDEKLTIADIASFLKDSVVEEAITQYGKITERITLDYARAFCDDVNYREIAEHLVEQYPKLLAGTPN